MIWSKDLTSKWELMCRVCHCGSKLPYSLYFFFSSIHFLANFMFFSQLSYACVLYISYPLMCWWTSRWFHSHSYCYQSGSEHGRKYSPCFDGMTRSGMTRPYGSSIDSLVINCQSDFQSGCTNFHLHRQCLSFSFLYLRQHLLPSIFPTMAILLGMGWNLKVVLIYTSLIVFMHLNCILIINISSLIIFCSGPQPMVWIGLLNSSNSFRDI